MRRAVGFAILALGAGAVLAQPAAEFEVVSVKPHPGIVTFSSNNIEGVTYHGVAITLLNIIEDAYDVQRNQVSGGPGWVTSDRFDVEAKAPGEGALTKERVEPMLQAMLADRFKLKVRHESREVPCYDMVVTKGGPKFRENPDPAARDGMVTSFDPSGIHVRASKSTMAHLAVQLSVNAGRPVVDKTGLAGEYAFTLDWAPDNSPAAIDGSATTLFTALQEQLGLKLEPSRTTQEMLTIESAAKPSQN